VSAFSEKSMGLVVSAKKNMAIMASNETGPCINVVSASGTGIVAQGGYRAACLNGDVEINGDLILKGNQQSSGMKIEGDLEVTGDVRLVNADCAEEFEVADSEAIDAGTVMVIDGEGAVRQSTQAYDRCVAGVVSGAGSFKPGIILGKQQGCADTLPLALIGRVFCKVDADYGAIRVGDLLTTSATPGHAMRAGEAERAFGAVIGKALRPLESGRGLIPILVALQ